MSKTIEILIRPDGQTTVQTKGFSGNSCREATKFLEQALGQTVAEQLTAEFHTSQATQQQNTRQQ